MFILRDLSLVTLAWEFPAMPLESSAPLLLPLSTSLLQNELTVELGNTDVLHRVDVVGVRPELETRLASLRKDIKH